MYGSRLDMRRCLADRDNAGVFRLLQRHGLSNEPSLPCTGQSQTELSEIIAGRRHVASDDLLLRIAEGWRFRVAGWAWRSTSTQLTWPHSLGVIYERRSPSKHRWLWLRRGDLQRRAATAGPPSAVMLGHLPPRRVPAHPGRPRRRQGRPRHRRRSPDRVRHLHRPRLRVRFLAGAG